MYFFDPAEGRRRRVRMADPIRHWKRRCDEFLEAAKDDLRHRAKGLRLEIQDRLHQRPLTDDVLNERVRERIGRSVRHPSSILVLVKDGTVTLRGPILTSEVDRLLRDVRSLRGVRLLEGRRSHWKVTGPAGTEVEWDAAITDWEPNRRLAWQTDPAQPSSMPAR